VIPDGQIDGWLKCVFGNSEPGQTLHHMVFAAAAEGEVTALGLPQLKVTIYAIAPTEDVDAGQFVARTIRGAIAEAQQNGTVPHFAALGIEAHSVTGNGDEVSENLGRRLAADGKLQEHPAAVEVTRLYAACRDGRRWTGEHILTGELAGTVRGPQLLTGAVGPQEAGLHARLIRAAVGLP